jgi:ABC-type sugar transport system substrate-binding protein
VLVARVAPDEVEIGHIQGRQVRAILPKGGVVLYVQGDLMTSGAVDRTAGMEEILANDSTYRIGKVDGHWSAARADTAVADWLRLVRVDGQSRLDLVCSQSELMLPGVRAALARVAQETGDSRLPQVPLIGCDGLPKFKQEVESGRLAATIEIPPRIPPAIRLLAEFWSTGKAPADPEVRLQPSSYPSLEVLASNREHR